MSLYTLLSPASPLHNGMGVAAILLLFEQQPTKREGMDGQATFFQSLVIPAREMLKRLRMEPTEAALRPQNTAQTTKGRGGQYVSTTSKV